MSREKGKGQENWTTEMKRTVKIELTENGRYYVMISLLFVLAAFLRFYQVTKIPYGIHVDEAGMAYDAYSLANFGVDRYLQRYPVYLTNFGRGQSALYAYLSAFFMQIGGGHMSVWAMRLPAIISGLCVFAFGTGILKNAFGQRTALSGSVLLAICPYFIMASRFGLDCNLMLGMATIGIYFLQKALLTQKRKRQIIWLITSGFFFGVTLYTYVLSFWVLCFFLSITALYLMYVRKLKIWHVIVWGLPVFLLSIPLLLFIYINSNELEPIQTWLFTIPRLPVYQASTFSLNYIGENLIAILNMIFTRDWIDYNAFDRYYTLYTVSIPFAMIGIIGGIVTFVKSIVKREFQMTSVITVFFFSEIAMGCLLEKGEPNINKLNAIYFTLVYFTVWGFSWLYRRLKDDYYKRAFTGVISVFYVVSFFFFSKYYFEIYPQEIYPQYLFESTCEKELEFVRAEADYDACFIDYRAQGYIYYLVGEELSPYEYDMTHGTEYYSNYMFSLEEPREKGAYIVKRMNVDFRNQIEESNVLFEKKEFDEYVVYYQPK